MTNIFNFMDGLDGLAGGCGVIVAIFFGGGFLTMDGERASALSGAEASRRDRHALLSRNGEDRLIMKESDILGGLA